VTVFTVLLCELPVVGEESTTMTIIVKRQRRDLNSYAITSWILCVQSNNLS